jgi:hypothetical protein
MGKDCEDSFHPSASMCVDRIRIDALARFPSLHVHAEDEEPHAERSFTKERGQLDPGDQLGCKPRRQEVREAIDQVGQAVKRQQNADGFGKKGRPMHQVGHADDVEAKEHRVDAVVNRRQTQGQICQRIQLCCRKSTRMVIAAEKDQRCELIDEAGGLNGGCDQDEEHV